MHTGQPGQPGDLRGWTASTGHECLGKVSSIREGRPDLQVRHDDVACERSGQALPPRRRPCRGAGRGWGPIVLTRPRSPSDPRKHDASRLGRDARVSCTSPWRSRAEPSECRHLKAWRAEAALRAAASLDATPAARADVRAEGGALQLPKEAAMGDQKNAKAAGTVVAGDRFDSPGSRAKPFKLSAKFTDAAKAALVVNCKELKNGEFDVLARHTKPGAKHAEVGLRTVHATKDRATAKFHELVSLVEKAHWQRVVPKTPTAQASAFDVIPQAATVKPAK